MVALSLILLALTVIGVLIALLGFVKRKEWDEGGAECLIAVGMTVAIPAVFIVITLVIIQAFDSDSVEYDSLKAFCASIEGEFNRNTKSPLCYKNGKLEIPEIPENLI